jgi:hypothetical protein
MRKALLGLLWLDGFLVGIVTVAFLQLTIGTVQLPITAIVAAGANCLLLWCSATLTDGTARFGALIAFGLAFFVATASGPGGDALMPQDWRAFALLGLGVGVPAVVSYAGLLPTADRDRTVLRTGARE